jgi:hypothetical protein
MMISTSLFHKVSEHNDKTIWATMHIAFTFCHWVYNNKYKKKKKKHAHTQTKRK